MREPRAAPIRDTRFLFFNGENGAYIAEYLCRYWHIANVLQGLCLYFRELTGETARFIKDEITMKHITKQVLEGEEACRELSDIISEIEGVAG